MQAPNTNNSPGFNDFLAALAPIMRLLDRVDERTQNLATRNDLEALRKELVARDSLEPQLNALRADIKRVDEDRKTDKGDINRRVDEVERDQIGARDRVWLRVGQAAGIVALVISMFEFLSRLRFLP